MSAPARARRRPGPRVVMTLGVLLGLMVAGQAVLGPRPLPLPLPGDGQVSYQLGGAYPPPAGTAVVVRDRSDPAVPDRYSVCYVNAFQTQPGADWPDDLVLGVEDPDWPGEFLLDTSTPQRRARILARVGGWIDGCADDGFEAVELDNLDSWTRSGGRLDRAGNLALAVALVDRGHARGLAVAQKNAVELVGAAPFDFAVVEECQVYGECEAYLDAYGDAVVEIEYDAAAFAVACAARGDRIAVVLRDRQVRLPDQASAVERTC